MKTLKITSIGLAFLVLGLTASLAQHEHVLQNVQDVKWMDAPPALPAGAKVAIMQGNPGGTGLYSMRVKLPANYKVPAHSHPGDEHVVVLSGTFYVGAGEKIDTSAGKALKPGGFMLMPAKKHHFAYTKEETIIMVYGIGPVDFIYVNPADDPRKADKK